MVSGIKRIAAFVSSGIAAILAWAAGLTGLIDQNTARQITVVAVVSLCLSGFIWLVLSYLSARQRYPVRLMFVAARTVPITWTVALPNQMPLLEPRLPHGSNSQVGGASVRQVTRLRADVARSVLENQSADDSMADAEGVAARITIWDSKRRMCFPPYRGRPPGNAEPWQGRRIPDRVNIPYLRQDHIDVAIRHRDTKIAYAFNTDSYAHGMRGENPERVLPPGTYTVRIRAKADNSAVTEGWFVLRNASDLWIKQVRRPRLASLRFR
jgi:hypothetical protein